MSRTSDIDQPTDTPALWAVLTLREVMTRYNLKDHKTVLIAHYTGRVRARKADAPMGKGGGVWLFDKASCDEAWGSRLQEFRE